MSTMPTPGQLTAHDLMVAAEPLARTYIALRRCGTWTHQDYTRALALSATLAPMLARAAELTTTDPVRRKLRAELSDAVYDEHERWALALHLHAALWDV